MDNLIQPVLHPSGERVEVGPLLAARVRFDLENPERFRKIRVAELAEKGTVGYRIVDGRLLVVLASKDGAMLKITPRRLENFLISLLEWMGVEFKGLPAQSAGTTIGPPENERG